MIGILVLTTFSAGVAYSKDGENMDVVLVMDSSGSMKKTDPMSLRIPAAKMFISLLGKNDRAAVVSFSDTSYPIINLTPVDNDINKDRLFKATDKISSTGLFTNLYDAFKGGLGVLSEGQKNDRAKIIVLMSDGMMDVGDTDKDLELVGKINNELAGTFEDNGIRVYTIAFTEQSDRILLEKISKRTGGFYNLAITDKDLHLIFTSIFESLKSPDMAPMSENGFLIDRSIEEVTIVATKGSPQTQIQLNSPDGISYSNKESSTGIGWFVSDNFDMITIKTPAEGRWEILFSTGENNKAYIITNLKLQTNFDQLYSTFGDPLDVNIWLEKDGNTIKEQAVLDRFKIYLELTDPDGKVTKLEPFSKGEGIFTRNITPFTPGNYKLRIVAQGNTFEREKAFVFNIADAKESREDILTKRKKASNAGEKKGLIKAGENDNNNISWKKVLMQFVLINLILGTIALVYFKRKRIINIKGIVTAYGRTKFIDFIKKKLGKKEGELDTDSDHNMQDVNSAAHEKSGSEDEIESETVETLEQDSKTENKEAQKEIKEDSVAAEQKEEESQIKEIPLEEENEGTIKLEEEKPLEETDAGTGEVKQASADENNNEVTETVNDTQWHEVDDKQQILSQDDLNQLLGAGEEKSSIEDIGTQETSIQSEAGEEETVGLTSEKEQIAEIDNITKDEEDEDLDKMWQEALQSQRNAEKEEEAAAPDEQVTALDMEIERLEKINKLRNDQMTHGKEGADEIIQRDMTENQQDKASGEMIEETTSDDIPEDMDAIWQEALQQQKAEKDGKKDDKEGISSD
ncbi:MAG: VWA domain-containing protein [Nitrospirota bacterium]